MDDHHNPDDHHYDPDDANDDHDHDLEEDRNNFPCCEGCRRKLSR